MEMKCAHEIVSRWYNDSQAYFFLLKHTQMFYHFRKFIEVEGCWCYRRGTMSNSLWSQNVSMSQHVPPILIDMNSFITLDWDWTRETKSLQIPAH